ncbi:hypothetical protein B9Z55_008097 [Caenorhabditis nigoni]|nr:hypothetical protein B9Z55_008097 [Caenorhabditis nigoni]
MRGWYEIRGKTLNIWEGVLTLYHKNLASCQLFKIFQDEIFETHVDLEDYGIEKMESDGYWECVEIRGEVSNGAHFLCHSLNTEHALKILKDSDPLKNLDKSHVSDFAQTVVICTFKYADYRTEVIFSTPAL